MAKLSSSIFDRRFPSNVRSRYRKASSCRRHTAYPTSTLTKLLSKESQVRTALLCCGGRLGVARVLTSATALRASTRSVPYVYATTIFLSLEDRSEGRFHYHAIARSLEHQLEKAIPDLNRSHKDLLGGLLETVALRLHGEGRRLIVIVDGLDHVWRDHRDHEDMEALFNALLPLPTNVRLVVGTQKIASEHLPARLLNALPTEHWTELPLMSRASVRRWLHSQDEAGRLNLTVVGQQTRGQVFRTVARVFHEISHGLPLHLIYLFEAIVRTGEVVTAEDVGALPACPTRRYSRLLSVILGEDGGEVSDDLACPGGPGVWTSSLRDARMLRKQRRKSRGARRDQSPARLSRDGGPALPRKSVCVRAGTSQT